MEVHCVTCPLCGEFTGHRWIPLTKASDAELWYLLWYAWINGWINNREASDLRRHRAPYNVTAILWSMFAIGHSTCLKHHDPTPIPHIPSCKMSMVWILTLDVLIVCETCVFAFHILPQWNNSCSWYVSSRNVRFEYHALSKPKR